MTSGRGLQPDDRRRPDPRGRPRAVGYCERAIRLLQAQGDRYGQAAVWDSLGYAHRLLGHHAKPSPATSGTSTCAARAATPTTRPTRCCPLATHIRPPGTQDVARRPWQQALAIIDDLHRPDAGQVRVRLLNPR
jgi:hypothetical protein